VRGEDRVVLSEIGRVHGFNGFPDLPMQQYTSCLDEPAVCYLAYAVVTEVESAVHYAQDPSANQLFETVCELAVRDTCRALEYSHVDVATDHRRHIGQAARTFT
jgi:hypothetical protein